MGLFDRFRKRIKQADEDFGITAEDGSAEAEQALQKRESLEEDIRKTREQEDPVGEGNSKTEPTSEWDEFEDELEDPFQKSSSSKARKLAARDQACLLYTSPSPRDGLLSRMPSSA